jgi:hypothetical protein
MILLYLYLYFQFLFNAFNYAIHASSYLLGSMFFAWLPFFFYLIELKFCKKQHGISYYISYLYIITIAYNLLQIIPLLLYITHLLRFYLFWMYIYTISNIVLVTGLSYIIFIIEYFKIPQHSKNFILLLCWLTYQILISLLFICFVFINYLYHRIKKKYEKTTKK